MVVWITGLSCAGKTSIGTQVYRLLKAKRPNVVFLDGEDVREIMEEDLGHTIADRKLNAMRISRLCRYLDSQGIDVVCATIAFFHEVQQWNRKHIPEYFEVYVRAPFDILLARDSRGLYRRALAGKIKNVVGVDIELPPPVNPDLILDNDVHVDCFVDLASKVVNAIDLANVMKIDTKSQPSCRLESFA